MRFDLSYIQQLKNTIHYHYAAARTRMHPVVYPAA